MFCHKCGTEIADGAAFCHKCGARMQSTDSSGQAKEGLRTGSVQEDHAEGQVSPPIVSAQVQPPAAAPGKSKTGKKKSRKIPLILGITILVSVILVVVIAVAGRTNDDAYSNSGVSLSQTYTNEAEGISFQYPGAWELSDPAEYYGTSSDLQTSLTLLVNKTGQELNSVIEVLKFSVDQGTIEHLFAGDEEFTQTFSGSASIIETSIVEVDGIKARRVAYIEQDELYYLSYMYGIGSTLYRINFISPKDMKGSFERFYDAVIESYTIKVSADLGNVDAQNISGEGIIYSLDYRGYTLAELLGSRREELDDIYGAPTGGTLVDGYLMYGGTEYHEYNGGEMYVMMSEETGIVAEITVTTEAAKLNGYATDLTREEIKGLFGEPSDEYIGYDESGEENGYVVEYILAEDGFYLSFWFLDMNTKAYDLTIGRYSEY